MAANENGMITEDSLVDPVKDARPVMELNELADALYEQGAPYWLSDAVSDAVANGDLAYLRRQVERHVPGWVTP